MTIDIRVTDPAEHRAACNAMRAGLLMGPISDEDWDKRLGSWDDHDSISAWDGARCVGHAGAFRFDTTVPGGAQLATAGVTRVGVLPTHTRQGLLTRMMHSLLRQCRDDGRPLASLRASEGVIYRRFGFGIAGDVAEWELDLERARPIANAAPGSVRLLDRAEILDVIPPLYERVAHTRPGVITRPPWMWRRYLGEALEGSAGEFVVVHTAPDGTDDGYAHYSLKWEEAAATHPHGSAMLFDLFGAGPAVELALWQYLVHIDLVTTLRAEERPVDDILRFAARDPRAYRLKLAYDEQWLRLLDVDTALSARTYANCADSVIVGVVDAVFTDNTGTWEIGTGGATRVNRPAQLEVAIDVISAAYMGGTSWYELAATGQVAVSDSAAITVADALFAHRPAPFCGSHF